MQPSGLFLWESDPTQLDYIGLSRWKLSEHKSKMYATRCFREKRGKITHNVGGEVRTDCTQFFPSSSKHQSPS